MIIKFKKIFKNAKTPVKAYSYDAGFDLTAMSYKYVRDYIEYGTGIAFEIPKGYVGLLFPRSSISNRDLLLANSVGVIDSGYLGEVKVRFKVVESCYIGTPDSNLSGNDSVILYGNKVYAIGDRIAQIVFIKLSEFDLQEVDSFNSSSEGSRGGKGFGSSGLN